MRVPQVFSATAIKNWHIEEEYEPGKWRFSRPCGFFTWWKYSHWRMRVLIAWKVFIGRYDAVNWQGTGEKLRTETNHRDVTEKEFGSVKHT